MSKSMIMGVVWLAVIIWVAYWAYRNLKPGFLK